MLETFFISIIIIAASIGLLCIKMLFKGKGFVSTHVDSSPALRKKGIFCARQQDNQMRLANNRKISEHSK